LGGKESTLIFALPIEKIGRIDPWCNGNTTDFGSVIYGSNPYGSTKKEEIIDLGLFFFYVYRPNRADHNFTSNNFPLVITLGLW
jgi:hypothetical protein